MHKWREHEYENVVMLQIQADEQKTQMVDSFAVTRENVKKHHTAVMSAKTEKRTLRDWFSAW